MVWYWRCGRCGTGTGTVQVRYGVWTVLTGTIMYGTVQYEVENRVAIRLVLFVACWGGVVVCECA
jgi:hypothetical protein